MRRKPGALVPLEIDICTCAAQLLKNGEDEFHGYDMAKLLAVAADRPSLAAYGTLYRALARLVDMGLLTSRWEDLSQAADANRPRRRLYTLTPDGRVAAREAQHKRHQAAAPRRARKGWAPA
jgi:PadR family transcriptional regulator PadR